MRCCDIRLSRLRTPTQGDSQLKFFQKTTLFLLWAFLASTGIQLSFAEDSEARKVSLQRTASTSGESDQEGETLGMDSTHEAFQVDVPGGCVNAVCLIGRTKKQLLGSFSTSAPKIVAQNGTRYDLRDTIEDDPATCELEIMLTDLMQEKTIRPILNSSLENEPKLKGLPWGTAKRESPCVNIELRVHDPKNSEGYRTLKSATIRTAAGKSQHLLRFDLDRECLQTLTKNRHALFVTASMSVLCRISVAQVVAEWQTISNESLRVLNDLKSAANGNVVMFMSAGGDLRADQGLRQYLQSRVQTAVWVKSGSSVPPDLVSSLIESAFAASKIAIQANATKADELISVVIANQIVVSGLRSNISELVDQTRLAVEKGELDANHTTREFSAGGSASFLGFGVGANASSGQSDKVQRERLSKDLADASKTFKGNISGFSAIDLNQVGSVLHDAISTGNSQLGTFHTRNARFEIDVNIDLADQNDRLLQSKLERESYLRNELRTLTATAKAEAELIENSLKDAGSIDEMSALLNQTLHFQRLVSRVDAFWEWGKHNAALGDGRCLDRVPEWLNAVIENGKTRQADCDLQKSQLTIHSQQLSSRIEKLAKIKVQERINGGRAGRMAELSTELTKVAEEIKTLRSLGAKE